MIVDFKPGWTDERRAILKRLWAEGLSGSQIAAQLGGVTRNAVIGKANREGLEPRAVVSVRARKLNPRKDYSLKALKRLNPRIWHPVPREEIIRTIQELEVIPVGSIPFLKLKRNDGKCRQPHGGTDPAKIRFCGKPVATGKTYCKAHYIINHTTVSGLK